MTPLNKKLFRDLWHMRGQALAIAGVISGGIATMIMALGAIDSLQETRRAYYEEYRFAEVFARAKRAPEWVLEKIGNIPGVSRVEGRIVEDIIIDVPDVVQPARGHVVSREVEKHTHLNDVVIRRGRDLRRGHPDEILVNEAFAESNRLELGSVIYGNINGRRRALRVVGIALSPEFVYAIGPGEIVPDDRHFGILWMSREALEAAYDLKGAFNDVTLTLARGTSETDVIGRLDQILGRYGGTGAVGRSDQLSDSFVTSEMDQLGHLATTMPPIFLAVAAFLFNVVIARIVQSDREQIGLLKAFGYRSSEVGWLYIKLVLVIAAIGVLVGWAMGAWMGHLVTRLYGGFFRFPFLHFVFNPATFVLGAAVGLAAAVLGAATAVHRAVALAPAVAMVPPPPSAYHTNLVERMGLPRIFSQRARMMFRHIFRWPLRAGITVLGTSLSVAILITSLFFFDSVNEMVETHFFETERQDMSVTFVDDRSATVKFNLDDLPGILAAETFRIVPAKLRLGQREERVAIQGLEKDARLNLLVDADHQAIRLPSAGLVVSDKMAELLGAREGDVITVQTLEGRRLVRQVPLMRIVRQYIGATAYMDRHALNRLMGEGELVTGAHLLTDSLDTTALYRDLKAMPALLGLAVRESGYQTFRDMIDEHLNTMVFFYVFFAALIGIGVIYNSARIALSERARELASLRVLGFTKREVGAILTGELAALIFVALPLGCLIGYGLAALMVNLFDTKLYRIPLIVTDTTYGYAVLVVLAAAAGSIWVVLRRVARLDLIAVLKTRE